jgi:superfamily II DNA or RNA helicase
VQHLPSTVTTGRDVDVRGDRWRVVSIEPFEHCAIVTLHGLGDDNRGDTTRLIAPFDRIQPATRRAAIVRTSRRTVLRAVARAIIAAPPWHQCWTAAGADIDLREWQLEPARAALAGATRLLLADAVGLGKTIQASLVIAELLARGLAHRVLVLTPASVRDQWARELSERMHVRATVFDQASLQALCATLPTNVNPWTTVSVIVSSIDLVKRPEVRVAVDAVPFDILVVDEAHHLTPGTDRAAVVADLASRVPWTVLVTATPHSGDEAAFQFLQSLGDVGARDDLRVFRRTASDVRMSPECRTRIVAVTPSSAERALLDASLEYARALWRLCDERTGAGLVGSIIARRAASCADSVLRTLQRRRQLLGGLRADDTQPALPWDEAESGDLPESDTVLGVPGFTDATSERALLDRLIDLAMRACDESSKVRLIRRLLRRTTETALVFSEYRDTVAWVAAQLGRDATVAILHGGLSAASRRDSIAAFTGGRVRVLVATDAAGEGLNLQACCRLVINLELPWNPLRLEQRVGRLARIGQRRTVHALHLVHRASFEDEVLAHVERRRLRAAGSLASITTSGNREAAPEQVTRRLATLAPNDSRSGRFDGPLLTEQRPEGHARAGTVVLFECDLSTASGYRIQTELIALRCVSGAPLELPLCEQLASQWADQQAVDAEQRLSALCRNLGRRLDDLRAAITARESQALVQGSLFDRRLEQQAHERHAARESWLARLRHLATTVEGMRHISRGRLRLIAVWPA